jgi:opacity protein-like surface antigen
MKAYIFAAALVAASAPLPAAAQAWYDPSSLLHNSYVELEGGASIQGRTKIQISATGLGSSSQSAAQTKDFFGGGLVGYNLADGVSVEAEGLYSRNNLYYSPGNAVFGAGGATRTYGGLGNLKFSLPVTPTYTVPLGAMSVPIGIKPYIAGGIGYGDIQFSGHNGIVSYDEGQDGFIWQAKAGVEFRTGNHFGLDIAYRYLQSPQYNYPGYFNSPGYTSLTRSHVQAVTAGVTYHF